MKGVKVPDTGYIVQTAYWVPITDGETNENCRIRAKALAASAEGVAEQHGAKMEYQYIASAIHREPK